MRIVYRNFIRLLSNGSFNNEEPLEAMSEFKWLQLLQIAITYDVANFVLSGIKKEVAKENSLISSNFFRIAQENIVQENTIPFKKTTHYNFTQTKIKKFSNFYLNHRLNKIVFNEIHSIDTSVTSLVFLYKLIDCMNNFLTIDNNFKSVIDLGSFLRESGDKIDFVKTDRWIKSLRMRNMSNLIGSYLVVLFDFTPDEVPFMQDVEEGLYEKIYKSLRKPTIKENVAKNDKNQPLRMGKIISPIYKPSTLALRYFSYFPLEVTSKFLGNISKSLSNVEE